MRKMIIAGALSAGLAMPGAASTAAQGRGVQGWQPFPAAGPEFARQLAAAGWTGPGGSPTLDVLGAMEHALGSNASRLEAQIDSGYVTPKMREDLDSAYRRAAVAVEEKMRSREEELVEAAARGEMPAAALDRAAMELAGFGFYGPGVRGVAERVQGLAREAHAGRAVEAAQAIRAELLKEKRLAGLDPELVVVGDQILLKHASSGALLPAPEAGQLAQIAGLRAVDPLVFHPESKVVTLYFAGLVRLWRARAEGVLPKKVLGEDGVLYVVFPALDPAVLDRMRKVAVNRHTDYLSAIPGVVPDGVAFDPAQAVFHVTFRSREDLAAASAVGKLPRTLVGVDPLSGEFSDSVFVVAPKIAGDASGTSAAPTAAAEAPERPLARVERAYRVMRAAAALRGIRAGLELGWRELRGTAGAYVPERLALEKRHMERLSGLSGVKNVSFEPGEGVFRVAFADEGSRRAAGLNNMENLLLPRIDPLTGKESPNGYPVQAEVLP